MSRELLSRRERVVAEMLATGFRNAETAAALAISQKTVDTHRRNIMRRLGLRNNAELAAHGIRAGWVPLDEPAEEPRLVAAPRSRGETCAMCGGLIETGTVAARFDDDPAWLHAGPCPEAP